MKNLARVTAVTALVLIGTTSFGQSLNFNGGFTTSKFISEDFEDSESSETFDGVSYTQSLKNKNLSGFNVGVGYEFKLGNRLSLETGLKYQTRGMQMERKYKFSFGNEYEEGISEIKWKMNYLDLPVVLNTAILTGDVRAYVRTGVYVGATMGGKLSQRFEYSSSDGDRGISEESEKISISDMDEEDILTGGAVFGVGAEYKGFYFEANYNVGTLSLIESDDNTGTRDLSFSLGYKLKFN